MFGKMENMPTQNMHIASLFPDPVNESGKKTPYFSLKWGKKPFVLIQAEYIY